MFHVYFCTQHNLLTVDIQAELTDNEINSIKEFKNSEQMSLIKTHEMEKQ